MPTSKSLPIPAAAKLSGYSAQHLRRLIKQKRIVAEKIMRDWVIDTGSLREYMRMHPQPPKE